MDARARWQALQAHLSNAQRALEVGDRTSALEFIDRALTLDPQFLAAHTLREHALAAPPVETPASAGLSTEGLIRFEQRARQRRIDRRLDYTRNALASGKFADARLALSEVQELDAHHPDLSALTSQLDAAEHRRGGRRMRPWLAAAAVFTALALGAQWFGQSDVATTPVASASMGLPPVTTVETPPLESVASFPFAAIPLVALPLATVPPGIAAGGPRIVEALPVALTEPLPAVAVPVATTAVEEPRVASERATSEVVPPSLAAVAHATPSPIVPSVESRAIAVNAPSPAIEVELVRDVLQRYRTAYERLDVDGARAVWPSVNEAALSRAFAELQSQVLTFNQCDVSLQGAEAQATCRGSARYVTKVGSRDPRVESRVWNFTLSKDGDDWRIATARAER